MSEFVGEEGEEKIVMSLQMSMMRALQAGFYVNPASPNRYPNTVLSLMGSNDQKVDQATSLFAGQFLGWLYATKYNLDPDARLDDIISDDGLSFNESYFTPQFNLNYANNNESNRNWNSATGKNNMLDEMQEIQEMITLYDETEYMDISDPLLLKRGESKIILTIPDEQEQFIHYIDYSNSKNLDYLDGLPEDGEEFTELEVTANRDIKPGDVEIAILKTTDTFWNEDYGYTGAVGKDDQFKTVLNMPRAYMKEGNISVVTANNIQVEKRDKETGDLIEDGEATFIIQSLKSNDKWSQFSVPGAPKEFTTENGIAVIDDEKLLDALKEYNGTSNDQKYRFREIEAPEGYKNPQPPVPLSANEAQGSVGDQFSVEFDMDDMDDGSLVLEMENQLKPDEIIVEKRDKETGDLIEDGEATFIIQSLKSNDKWSQFSVPGAPEEFTTENGIAVIDDEKVINALHQYNGTSNDQKYRFREIEAPEGYKNPQPPVPLSANEAQGSVGDQFSVEFDMDDMDDGSLVLEMENQLKPDEIIVEKRDKETGDLIEDGEATFIIQSLKSNDKWSQFSVPGAPEEFTTENGIAVIDDEKVINALHQYNGTPNDQKYRFREIEAPEGYVNPRAPIPLSANEAQGGVGDQFSVEFDMDDAIDGSLVLEMENELYLLGDVFLEKVDRFNSRNYLEGAEFSLYKINEDGDFDEVEDHDLIYEGLKTDRYGELLVEELELGDYFFLETQAPEGYSLPSYPDNRHDFTITKDSASSGELIKLEVENTPLGNVFLEKVDADNENKYLSGAIFELYKLGEDEDDEDEGELLHFGLETDRSGEIRVEGLEVGRYYFKEVEAPEGYMLPEAPDDRFYFDITEENIEEGIEVELLIPNFAEGTRGSVWLEKISSQDPNRYLSGAIFDLYEVNEDGEGQEDDRLVEAGLEVDQYGDLRVQNLPLGKYYFLETQAPDGYFLPSYPDNRFDFEITKDNLEPGVEVEVKAPNDPISARKLTLLKEDSRTGEGLQGAEFKIQEKDGDGWKTYNSVYVTDKNGKFTVDFDSDPERWTGKTFRFVEVKAPDGYLLPEGEDIYTEEFTVLANDIQDMEGNSIRQLQKLNYLDIQEYSLQLRKIDDKGQSLDGAEFTLSSDQEEQSPIVSPGQNGIFIFSPLQPDVTYTLTETKAPDGYVIDNSPYTILLRTEEEAEGKIEIHRGDQLLVEGEDYQWNSENLELVMTIENRKPNTLPFTGGMGIIGLLIGGSMAIGLAYNFQIKKKII